MTYTEARQIIDEIHQFYEKRVGVKIPLILEDHHIKSPGSFTIYLASHGVTAKFWTYYRSNFDFSYTWWIDSPSFFVNDSPKPNQSIEDFLCQNYNHIPISYLSSRNQKP
jgi:hypothetical protein